MTERAIPRSAEATTITEANRRILLLDGFLTRFRRAENPTATGGAIDYILEVSGLPSNQHAFVRNRLGFIANRLDTVNPKGRLDGSKTSSHSLAVAFMAATELDSTPERKLGMILLGAAHDLLEDTPMSVAEVMHELGPRITEGVVLLTRTSHIDNHILPDLSQADYARRLQDLHNGSVKLLDGSPLFTEEDIVTTKVYDNVCNLRTMDGFIVIPGVRSAADIAKKHGHMLTKSARDVFPLTRGRQDHYAMLRRAYAEAQTTVAKKPLTPPYRQISKAA